MKQVILATDDDARHYTVYDGQGNRIASVTKVDLVAGTVEVMVHDDKGWVRIKEPGEVVTVTYRPPGGVVVTDDRDQPCDAVPASHEKAPGGDQGQEAS